MDEWIKKGAYGSRRMALTVSDGMASCRRRQGFDESREEEAEETASEKSDECIHHCAIFLDQRSPISTVEVERTTTLHIDITAGTQKN